MCSLFYSTFRPLRITRLPPKFSLNVVFSCICVANYAKLLQIITANLSLSSIYPRTKTKNWHREKISIRKIVESVVNSIVKSSASA